MLGWNQAQRLTARHDHAGGPVQLQSEAVREIRQRVFAALQIVGLVARKPSFNIETSPVTQLFAAALLVQRQQAAQNFCVFPLRGVVAPAIGVGNGLVQRFVREGEPRWAQVVEVCEGALF